MWKKDEERERKRSRSIERRGAEERSREYSVQCTSPDTSRPYPSLFLSATLHTVW